MRTNLSCTSPIRVHSCWSDLVHLDKIPAAALHITLLFSYVAQIPTTTLSHLVTERIIVPRSIQVFPKQGLKNQRHQFSQSLKIQRRRQIKSLASSRSSLLLSNDLSHCNFATRKAHYSANLQFKQHRTPKMTTLSTKKIYSTHKVTKTEFVVDAVLVSAASTRKCAMLPLTSRFFSSIWTARSSTRLAQLSKHGAALPMVSGTVVSMV